MLWFTVWTVIVLGTVVGAFVVGRDLWRKARALLDELGRASEVFGELEKYFRLQQKLWRQFRSQIAWPMFQFFAAVFVITGLIWLLGVIAETRGGEPVDALGLGLVGAKGAVTFLASVFGLIALGVGLYLLATRLLRQAGFDAANLAGGYRSFRMDRDGEPSLPPPRG